MQQYNRSMLDRVLRSLTRSSYILAKALVPGDQVEVGYKWKTVARIGVGSTYVRVEYDDGDSQGFTLTGKAKVKS